FSLLLSAGVPVTEAIKAVIKQTRSKRARLELEEVNRQVAGGAKITTALAEYKLVDENLLTIIRLGEESGSLPGNLEVAASQKRYNEQLKSKLLSASLYPMLVTGILGVVGLLVFVFVLPRLSLIYKSFNADLPAITRLFIDIGTFMEANWVYVIPSILIGVPLIIYLVFYRKRSRWLGQNILYSVPAIKSVIQQSELSRLGYLGSTLLDRGIKLPEALQLLSNSTSFHQFQKLYSYLQVSITAGNSLDSAFSAYPHTDRYLSSYVIQSLTTGEKSGFLQESLAKIGEVYKERVDISIKNLLTLFEPMILIVVWAGVAFLALSVILPIYSVFDTFNQPNTQISSTNQTIKDTRLDNTSPPPFYVVTNFPGTYAKDGIDGEDSKQLDSLTPYLVINSDGDWYHLSFDDDTEGWINKDQVTISLN
ncbi:type II secretion system F family protein, partial [Candidatus Dojkabacteria bacterium]|nr:type II secretion system F family protein [Candidatus Dojkabacteria bacterium]